MSEWIDATKHLPTEECEIFFIAREDVTSECIGLAIPESQIVLLKHTDMPFSELRLWMPLPKIPYDSCR